MLEFVVTLRRTVTQEMTQLVAAADEDAVWLGTGEGFVTNLSDWEIVETSETIHAVAVR